MSINILTFFLNLNHHSLLYISQTLKLTSPYWETTLLSKSPQSCNFYKSYNQPTPPNTNTRRILHLFILFYIDELHPGTTLRIDLVQPQQRSCWDPRRFLAEARCPTSPPFPGAPAHGPHHRSAPTQTD